MISRKNLSHTIPAIIFPMVFMVGCSTLSTQPKASKEGKSANQEQSAPVKRDYAKQIYELIKEADRLEIYGWGNPELYSLAIIAEDNKRFNDLLEGIREGEDDEGIVKSTDVLILRLFDEGYKLVDLTYCFCDKSIRLNSFPSNQKSYRAKLKK